MYDDDDTEKVHAFTDETLRRHGAADGESSDTWPDPQPLTAKIDPVPFPIEVLPDPIRRAVEEVCGYVKTPVSMAVASAMSVLSLATQAHIDVRRDEVLVGPVSLSMLTIAESGERKTQVDKLFMQPIEAYQERQAELAAPLVEAYNAKLAAWEAQRQGVLQAIRVAGKARKPTEDLRQHLVELEAQKPKAPKVPKLTRMDATPEGLAKKLEQEWPSAGIISNEAGIVFGSHGMGRESITRNMGLLNMFWDGSRFQSDRADDQRDRDVRGARLTMGLMVQESTLRAFFEQSQGLARGTGFMARFLMTWPASTMGTRLYESPPEGMPALAVFHQRIAEILKREVPRDDNGRLQPKPLELSPPAKALWIAYHDSVEMKLGTAGDLYDVKDVAAKSADNAARIAALFQYFASDDIDPIDSDSVRRASETAGWYLQEGLRFLGEFALPSELAHAARLDAWLIAHCRQTEKCTVPKNHVRQYVTPIWLRDKKMLDPALDELVALHRIKVESDGRRMQVYVNPKLLHGDGA